MSSKLGVQNIAHTNGTNAMTIASDGATTFTSDPFNSVIETWIYDTTSRTHSNGDVLEEAWNRKTDILTANKNGGMSVSSGIFTFPSTGIWRIELDLHFYSSTSTAFIGGYAQITTDNSNYNDQQARYQSVSGGSRYGNVVLTHVLNITDITNQKIRWVAGSAADFTVAGGTSSINSTVARFIKLCPSV
jgi:hypothetical protein